MVSDNNQDSDKPIHNGNGNGRFVKGDPRINKGNRTGRRGFATLLKEMGKEKDEKTGEVNMNIVCKALWDEAKKGEPWAIQALMDRTDGKARQAIEMVDNHANIGALSDDELTALYLANSQS